jgi:hypothetical protein
MAFWFYGVKPYRKIAIPPAPLKPFKGYLLSTEKRNDDFH